MLQNISVVHFIRDWRPDSRMVLPLFSFFFGTENSKETPAGSLLFFILGFKFSDQIIAILIPQYNSLFPTHLSLSLPVHHTFFTVSGDGLAQNWMIVLNHNGYII
jgi:hypothetical protein